VNLSLENIRQREVGNLLRIRSPLFPESVIDVRMFVSENEII